jgi:signal transduction histidine kinase
VKLPLPEKESMDVNESAKIVLASFSTLFKEKNITVNSRLEDKPVLIYADRSQMEQVFANIIKNSAEAIDRKGRITITTRINPLIISFEDNGTGLSEEISERIFTPFFTTKPGGQGIGLTLIREILSNHGFSFSFSNRKSGGTEFIIKC